MTRREWRTFLLRLKVGEKLSELERDKDGKLNRLFSKRDLLELNKLGFLEVPKNFLDELGYTKMLMHRVQDQLGIA